MLTAGAFGLGGNSIPIATASNSDLSKMPAIPFNAIREYKSSDGTVPLIGVGGMSPGGNLAEWLAPENGHDGKKIAVRNKDSLFVLYSTGNKPTANDVDAVSAENGGIFKSPITGSYVGDYTWAKQFSTKAPFYSDVITSTTASEYRPHIKQRYALVGEYSQAWSMGVLIIGGDNPTSSIALHCVDPKGVSMQWSFNVKDGTFVPQSYANFDQRYQVKGNYTPAGQAYTKNESDGRFQPLGNYALVGASYTKVESDYRYYTKAVSDAAYAPASWSYSKSASDARYVTAMRLGSRATTASQPFMFEVPTGCVITGLDVAGDSNATVTAYYRPIQVYLNGAWRTVGAA